MESLQRFPSRLDKHGLQDARTGPPAAGAALHLPVSGSPPAAGAPPAAFAAQPHLPLAYKHRGDALKDPRSFTARLLCRDVHFSSRRGWEKSGSSGVPTYPRRPGRQQDPKALRMVSIAIAHPLLALRLPSGWSKAVARGPETLREGKKQGGKPNLLPAPVGPAALEVNPSPFHQAAEGSDPLQGARCGPHAGACCPACRTRQGKARPTG